MIKPFLVERMPKMLDNVLKLLTDGSINKKLPRNLCCRGSATKVLISRRAPGLIVEWMTCKAQCLAGNSSVKIVSLYPVGDCLKVMRCAADTG